MKVLELVFLTLSRSKFFITEKSAHFPNAKSCAITYWMVINMTRWPTVFILILNCRSMLLNWLSKRQWWKSSFLEFYIPKLSRFACLVFTNRNVTRLTIAWKSGNPVRSRMKAPWFSFWLNFNLEKMQHFMWLADENCDWCSKYGLINMPPVATTKRVPNTYLHWLYSRLFSPDICSSPTNEFAWFLTWGKKLFKKGSKMWKVFWENYNFCVVNLSDFWV